VNTKVKPINVAIVGCGLVGRKRASALGPEGHLVACADIDISRAKGLAKEFDAKAYDDWRPIMDVPEVTALVVATRHDSLAEITLAAVETGKHVLVEKPAARTSAELDPLIAAVNKSKVKVHVGFNHRYHRSLRQAKEIIDRGELGELMYIRGRYGHGGRLGYEKEWRAQPEISGGGELIDQGPHLIDLSRWFLGEFTEVDGFSKTYYWDMPVDDNAFLTLKTEKKQVAFLHVSCTEWKNLFSLEIYGHKGKLDLSGLGGSYGVERITHYRMLPEMGPPETFTWEYPTEDDSWSREVEDFFECIRKDRPPSVTLSDASKTLKIVENIYSGSAYGYCA